MQAGWIWVCGGCGGWGVGGGGGTSKACNRILLSGASAVTDSQTHQDSPTSAIIVEQDNRKKTRSQRYYLVLTGYQNVRGRAKTYGLPVSKVFYLASKAAEAKFISPSICYPSVS